MLWGWMDRGGIESQVRHHRRRLAAGEAVETCAKINLASPFVPLTLLEVFIEESND
jgi:hypothetical protein